MLNRLDSLHLWLMSSVPLSHCRFVQLSRLLTSDNVITESGLFIYLFASDHIRSITQSTTQTHTNAPWNRPPTYNTYNTMSHKYYRNVRLCDCLLSLSMSTRLVNETRTDQNQDRDQRVRDRDQDRDRDQKSVMRPRPNTARLRPRPRPVQSSQLQVKEHKSICLIVLLHTWGKWWTANGFYI